MSWDVMIHRFEGPPPRVEDIVDDHLFLPLGDAAEVRSRVSSVLPGVDWTDPAWGIFGGFVALAIVLMLIGWITDRRRARAEMQ